MRAGSGGQVGQMQVTLGLITIFEAVYSQPIANVTNYHTSGRVRALRSPRSFPRAGRFAFVNMDPPNFGKLMEIRKQDFDPYGY